MKLYVLIILMIECWSYTRRYPPVFSDPNSSAEYFKPFPKKLWTYYDTGLKGKYRWTTLCVNNMIHYAQESGWEFNFITDENYTKPFTPETAARVEKVFKQIQNNVPFVQAKSDIMRAFLMLDHGGLWVDANTMFLGKLDWVNRLFEIPYIYNRFFPDPQVVTFSYNDEFSGNKTQVWDEDLKRNVYLFPGMEHWCFIAQPNSLFFQDIVKNLQRSIQIGPQKRRPQVSKNGVKLHTEDDSYYYYGSYQTITTLQLQQYKMEANPSAYKTKYAVQYYKMWTFDQAFHGVILTQHIQPYQVLDIFFQFTREDFQDMLEAEVYPFSLKTSGWINGEISKIVQSFLNKNCSVSQNQLRKDSVFYRHIVNISSHFPEVDQLKAQFSHYQGKPSIDCGKIMIAAPSLPLLADYIPVIFKICLCCIILLAFCCFQTRVILQRENTKNKQHIKG